MEVKTFHTQNDPETLKRYSAYFKPGGSVESRACGISEVVSPEFSRWLSPSTSMRNVTDEMGSSRTGSDWKGRDQRSGKDAGDGAGNKDGYGREGEH